MRHIALALVLGLAMPAANSASSEAECAVSDQALSETAWVKGERHEYEDPAAGISIAFKGKYGPGTVYVYDAGIADWADGVSDTRLNTQMDEAIAGVTELVKRGVYSDVVFQQPIKSRLACLDFMLVTFSGKRDGHPMQSTAALTVRHGKVFKFRATFYREPERSLETETEALVVAAMSIGVLQ